MIKNIEAFCHYFYATTLIPVSFHHDGRFLSVYPDDLRYLYSDDNFDIRFFHFSKELDFCVTASQAYFGYIKFADDFDFLLVGPVFSTPVSYNILHDFMQEFMIAANQREKLAFTLSSIPTISYAHFLNILSFLHLCLNDNVEDLNYNLTKILPSTPSDLDSHFIEQISSAKEEHNFHNTYAFEQEICSYIQKGDTQGLEYFICHASSSVIGVMAKDPLRQAKNIFICLTTLATRSAITGGLDVEQAYQLSDVYIQKCENMQDINAVSLLQYSMLTNFTDRVAKSQIPQGMSPEIFQCVQFISRHTADSIGIDDIVEHVGRSRSYLTKKFKEELGFNMGAFIMRCKLEEAKSLLTYSAKSLSEISNFLCFSSQAYFQTVFKKKYGLTPLEYRNQTRKTN